MNRFVGIIAVGLALWVTGWADTVFTRDGAILRGKISLTTNGAVRIVSTIATNTVAPTNLVRALLAPAASRPGLSGISFQLYEGDWKKLPNLKDLPPDRSGILLTNRVDLSPLGAQGSARRVFDLSPDQVLKRWETPAIAGRPFAVSATIQPTAADGVILAHGGYMDGYILHLDKGHLVFYIISNRKGSQVRSENPLPLNQSAVVTARVYHDGNMLLQINGKAVGNAVATEMLMRMPFDGLSVGRDTGLPMDKTKGENPFKGTLKGVRVVLGGTALVYSGYLQVSTAGPHQFNLDSDAATKLEIDGRVVIDNTDLTKPAQPWGTTDLAPGPHQFRLTYAQLLPPQPVPGKAVPPQVISTIDKPWIEDKLPAGVVFTQGKFEFVSAPSPVYSGARSLKLSSPKKVSGYFNSDRHVNKNIEPLILAEGDRFYAYAYLDPKDPPEALEMAWHDRRGWEHRAYWGQNLFDGHDKRHNTQRLWPMGPLPPPGKWARLEVPALAVGYAPNSPWPSVHGWGFQVAGGTVYYDQAGVASPITVPAANTRHLRLEWFGPGITDHALSAVADPRAPSWRPDDLAVPKAGLLTTDGSYIPQTVKKIDEKIVQIGNMNLDRAEASVLFLRPLTVTEARGLRGKPHGALLQDGSFLEGKPIALDAKTVTINSVLHGLKTYKLNEEAVALVFKAAVKPPSRHHFLLRDGSRLFARQFEVKGAQIVLSAPPFPGRAIPLSQIAEITHGNLSNPLQQAEIHWQAHSEAGRQFLQTRDTANRKVMQQHRNLVIDYVTTTNEIAQINKDIPPLIQAETDAMAALTKAMTNQTALTAKVTANNKTHIAARTVLAAAQSKLNADCLKSDQASQSLIQIITVRKHPGQRSLANTQQRALDLAAAQIVTQRETAAVETAIHQANTARLAAEAAATASDKTITAAQAKLTAAQATRATSEKDLMAKQKTALGAHTALATARTNQLRTSLGQLATASHAQLQAQRNQVRLDLRARQLVAAIKQATTNASATTKAAQAAATALTAAKTQTNTAAKATTTAKTQAATATTSATKTKQDLAALQATQLNPAIAKTEATAKALTDAIKAKPIAARKLAEAKKIADLALKATMDANKLAQTKFSPEQLKKDREAVNKLAAQLELLAEAAQAPIDTLQAERLNPATTAAKAATNALTKAMTEKKAADLALATLQTSITQATTTHQSAVKALTAAEAKAKAAQVAATTATNTLKTAQATVMTRQAATDTAKKAMNGKHLARLPTAQAFGQTQDAVFHYHTNQLQAIRTLTEAKAALAQATATAAAATATAKLATAAQAKAKIADTALTATGTTTATKRTALNTTRKALDVLLVKQPAATAATTATALSLTTIQAARREATNRVAGLAAKITTATANLKTVEADAKANQDKEQVDALREKVAFAKALLNDLTTTQKQSTAKATTVGQSLAKALTARDTAAKAVTALNLQVAAATLAWRKADEEFTIALAAEQAASISAEQAELDIRQAGNLATIRKDAAATAADILKNATAFNTAALAKSKAAATAITKAVTEHTVAAKSLVTATQQATVATLAYRAAAKSQQDAEALAATAQTKLDEAAKAQADEEKLAQAKRTKAGEAKLALDKLAVDQQKAAKERVAATTQAITDHQTAKNAAELAQKNARAAITSLAPTIAAAKDAQSKVEDLKATAMGDPVMAAKLDAEKKTMAVAVKKFTDTFMAVNQKQAAAAATAANTAVTQAQTAKATADKASNTVKLKAADATTVLQKANQTQIDAEAAVKKTEMALAQAMEDQTKAATEAMAKTKTDEVAKAALAAHMAEQNLVVVEQAKAKTTSTAVLAERTKQFQASQAAYKTWVALVQALNTADKAVADAEVKSEAAQGATANLANEVDTLKRQSAAWKDRAARLQGDLSRLSALRQAPTLAMTTKIDNLATTALTSKSSAEKSMLTVITAAVTQELARRAAVQMAGEADDAELKAQQAEADAWSALVEVKASADQAKTTYDQAQQEYRVRKSAADVGRAKLATLQKSATAAQAQLKALQPAYEAIIRP